MGWEGLNDDPRRFATREGIRIGSARADVERVFGKPASTWDTFMKMPRSRYDGQGTLFDFTEDRAYAMGVYRAALCGEGHDTGGRP